MALTIKKTSTSNYIEDTMTFTISGINSLSRPNVLELGIVKDNDIGTTVLMITRRTNITNKNISITLTQQELNNFYSCNNEGINMTKRTNARVLISYQDNNSNICYTAFYMYIKPAVPTFNQTPTYLDTNSESIALTNDNQMIVDKLSILQINNVTGSAKKYGSIQTIKINEKAYTWSMSSGNSITHSCITNPLNKGSLAITLVDSRGWTNTYQLADISKFKYMWNNLVIQKFEVNHVGISEDTQLSANGIYCGGFQVGTTELTVSYKYNEGSGSFINGDTTLYINKHITTEYENFLDILDEYNTPSYNVDNDNLQYYDEQTWNNIINDLFESAIIYNNKYTKAYLQVDYDSVNQRYYCKSGSYNGSWHNFWKDTLETIYDNLYETGGNYEFTIVDSLGNEDIAIKGDTQNGFSMNKTFNVKLSMQTILNSIATTIESQVFLPTALPAIDIYKDNVALHGLYNTTLGGTQIEGDLLADFVTEFDNNGTWAWRKWHSGWVELFAYHQFTGLNLTSSSAGTYYGTAQTIDLPFKLVDFFYANGQETRTRTSGVYVYDISLTNNNTKISTSFRAHASSSNVSCGVKYYILGTYK